MATNKWYKSKNRWIYLRISMRHYISPKKVQMIAHGFRELDNNGVIGEELVKAGVIRKLKTEN
jgi:hypothetical protein